MEDILLEFENRISEILQLFNKAKDGIGDRAVSKEIRDYIERFGNSYEEYKITLNGSNAEKIAEAANRIGVYGEAFGRNLSEMDLDKENKIAADNLRGSASELRKIVGKSPIFTAPLTAKNREAISNGIQNYQSLKKQLEKMTENQKVHSEHLEKILNEGEKKATLLEEKVNTLESDYRKKLKVVAELYESELVNIQEKNTQINNLLGDAASRVIVSEYALSAEQERKAANWLRICSLVCMTLIVVIAGYSFLESITQNFDLSNALLRLALVFLLSVPAAYLARESTKHRQQQYTHLQTSLDLKAINPYIASLPEEEQHKIKSEIAQRIFAPKDFQSVSNESYPINSQEVIMALISKFGNDKDKSAD